MPKQKKKFIDKKSAVTFHLVHRSQQDPLIADETAPQRVLIEAGSAPATVQPQKANPEKRKEEQRKYGVYFDDEYDYLQHLRKPGDGDYAWEYVPPPNVKTAPNKDENEPKLKLPSSVFASEFEEDVGLLRKAAPQHGPRPDWDPDIVAALDDDFDFDNPSNHLDDDFMAMAMDGGNEEDDGSDLDSDDDEYSDVSSTFSGEGDEDGDELGSLKRFDKEETKSRFTEYSMSSSVMRRNEQLELLDERFEKFFEKYDDPDIGPLDCEEIEGHVELKDELLNQCWVELKKDGNMEEYKKEWDKIRIEKLLEEDSSDEELVELDVEDDRKKKWDCESILSTYSNIYNHPKLIEEPRKMSKISINPKTGVPLNVFHGENTQLTAKSLAKLNTEHNSVEMGMSQPKSLCAQSVLSTLSVLSIRPKDETPAERAERKRLLREYRNERRIEKKANTLAFKEEKKRQDKIKINNRNNIQGNKIV